MGETYKGQARRIAAETRRSAALETRFTALANAALKLSSSDDLDNYELWRLQEIEAGLRWLAAARKGPR
jgi:hypothetical protein